MKKLHAVFDGIACCGACLYPLVAPFSRTFGAVLEIVILVAWLLSGNWKEKLDYCRTRPILRAVILMVLVTVPAIFLSGLPFVQALKMWLSQQPYLFMFVLAMVLHTSRRRDAALAMLSLAGLATLGFTIYYYYGHEPAVLSLKSSPMLFFRNTIAFGISLALWAGLWVCFPYRSRNMAIFRHRMLGAVRQGMKIASRFCPSRSIPLRRRSGFIPIFWGDFFIVFRWAVILFLLYLIFWCNPSRTAQLGTLIACFFVAVQCFGRIKGTVVGLLLILGIFSLAYVTSDTFHRKLFQAGNETNVFIEHIDSRDDFEKGKFADGRLSTYKILLYSPEFRAKPVFGHGVGASRNMALKTTEGIIKNTHSEYIHVYIQSGMIGLLGFFFFIGTLFWRSIRRRSGIWPLGLFVCLFFAFDSLFNCSLAYNYSQTMYVILLAVIAAADQPIGTVKTVKSRG